MARSRGRPRKEGRAEDILAAALDVFIAKGFAGARLDDIAARAGVSKGTLYLYFDNKEAMFEALVQTAIVPNIERLETVARTWQGTQADLLRHMLQALAAALREGRIAAFPKLIIGEASNFPELARRYREQVIMRALALFGGVIARGIEAGEFRPVDPETAARLVVAPFLLAAIWRACFARFDPEPPDESALLARQVDLLLAGLLVRAPGEEPRR
jgi:AcrR family transcriptional regulator